MKSKFGLYRNVLTKEFRALINTNEKSLVVIDVRTNWEVEETGLVKETARHLPMACIANGALLQSPSAFLENFGFDKPDKEDRLLFTCSAGIRSITACKFALYHGYKNVLNYKPGTDEYYNKPLRLSPTLE